MISDTACDFNYKTQQSGTGEAAIKKQQRVGYHQWVKMAAEAEAMVAIGLSTTKK